jgi:uncharacterized protein YdeI (BOF family)
MRWLITIAAAVSAMTLAACGGSSGNSQPSMTCGQYQDASRNAQIAYVQSVDSKVAINPNNTAYWQTGITSICSTDGTPQSSIHQLLVNLGYLGPGQ